MNEGMFIWMRSLDSIESDEKFLKDTLQKFITDVRIFEDMDECVENLLSICEEKVFLRLGRGLSYLLSIMNDFNQV